MGDGEVVPLYVWRPIGEIEHAFSRFRNRRGAEWLVTMCNTRTTPYVVRQSEINARLGAPVVGKCFACRMLMNDQLT